MPHSLEFPGMRRAVVPLMRAQDTVVEEFVTDRCPRFSTVVGTLYQLPEPRAVLRRIEPLCINGRSLQMEYLPAGEVGARKLPLFAHCIGSQNECTLARPHEYSYATHHSPMRRSLPHVSGRSRTGGASGNSLSYLRDGAWKWR